VLLFPNTKLFEKQKEKQECKSKAIHFFYMDSSYRRLVGLFLLTALSAQTGYIMPQE